MATLVGMATVEGGWRRDGACGGKFWQGRRMMLHIAHNAYARCPNEMAPDLRASSAPMPQAYMAA